MAYLRAWWRDGNEGFTDGPRSTDKCLTALTDLSLGPTGVGSLCLVSLSEFWYVLGDLKLKGGGGFRFFEGLNAYISVF